MSARGLIVDDFAPNLKLLEARLTAEYFDVITASSGPEALIICGQGDCGFWGSGVFSRVCSASSMPARPPPRSSARGP